MGGASGSGWGFNTASTEVCVVTLSELWSVRHEEASLCVGQASLIPSASDWLLDHNIVCLPTHATHSSLQVG